MSQPAIPISDQASERIALDDLVSALAREARRSQSPDDEVAEIEGSTDYLFFELRRRRRETRDVELSNTEYVELVLHEEPLFKRLDEHIDQDQKLAKGSGAWFANRHGMNRVLVSMCSLRTGLAGEVKTDPLRSEIRRQRRFIRPGAPHARRSRTRTREHRSHTSRRRVTSRSSGGGSDDPAPEPPSSLGLERHPRYGLINTRLASFLAAECIDCGNPLVVEHGKLVCVTTSCTRWGRSA